MNWNFLLSYSDNIVLIAQVMFKSAIESCFIQIRFKSKYFLCDFLVLTLDVVKLLLSEMIMEAFSLREICQWLLRLTFNDVLSRRNTSRCLLCLWLFTSRNLYQFLKEFLILSLNFSLTGWLFIFVDFLFISEISSVVFSTKHFRWIDSTSCEWPWLCFSYRL